MAVVQLFQARSRAVAFPGEMHHVADLLTAPRAGSHPQACPEQRSAAILHLFPPKQVGISNFRFWTPGKASEHVSEWPRKVPGPKSLLPGKRPGFGAVRGLDPQQAWGS